MAFLHAKVPPDNWITSSWISMDERPTHMTEPTIFRSMSTLIGFFKTILSTDAVTRRSGLVVLSSSEQCWNKTMVGLVNERAFSYWERGCNTDFGTSSAHFIIWPEMTGHMHRRIENIIEDTEVIGFKV